MKAYHEARLALFMLWRCFVFLGGAVQAFAGWLFCWGANEARRKWHSRRRANAVCLMTLTQLKTGAENNGF